MRMTGQFAFALSAMALAGSLAACGARNSQPAASVAPTPAGLLLVSEQNAPDYKSVSAILTNRDVGDARARIAGTLARLLVKEGDTVKRGQVVAIIADPHLALEAQAGAAGVIAAQAQAERAQSDLKRNQTLFDHGYLSAAGMDSYRAAARAAQAQWQAARAQHGALVAVNAQGRVLAPADGRVTRAAIPAGAVVMPGDVVVGIATGARVLRLDVPEADGRLLSQGRAIEIIPEDGGAPRFAQVRQVYPAVDNGRVMADLDAAGLDAGFIGARVRVLVPVGARPALIVPSRYIETRFGVDYVRLYRSGGVIEAPIQCGGPLPTETLPDGVEVLSGLRAGDRILPAAGQS